jgi:hypothetical protein
MSMFSKEMNMKTLLIVAALSALGLNSGSLNAASPYPMGMQRGMDGGMRGQMCCGAKDTTGWALMSADERKAHRQKMMDVKTYDDCKTMHDEHMKLMEARAKEQGKTFTPLKTNMCDRMKDSGVLK